MSPAPNTGAAVTQADYDLLNAVQDMIARVRRSEMRGDEMRPLAAALIAQHRLTVGAARLAAAPADPAVVERMAAFQGHDRMDWATLNGPWRAGGWGDEVVANRTTVMRFIGTIDALLAALTATQDAGAAMVREALKDLALRAERVVRVWRPTPGNLNDDIRLSLECSAKAARAALSQPSGGE